MKKSKEALPDYYTKIIEGFLKSLEKEGKSDATIVAYKNDIEQFFKYLVDCNLLDVKDVDLERLKIFKDSLLQDDYTPKTVSRKINSLRTMYRFLLESGRIENNPSLRLTHPKLKKNKPRILSKMEFQSLRDAASGDIRLYTIIELLLQTGLRIGELKRLRVSDIKSTPKGKKYVHVKAHASQASRKVPLNQKAWKAVHRYLLNRTPPREGSENHLFVSKTGRPLLVRNIRSSINRAFKKAGVENARVNDIRNTFIAYHLKSGASLSTVARAVGHKRITTTEKYLELVKKDKKEEFKPKEL